MRENPIQAAILLALGQRRDCRVARRNRGALPDRHGRLVRYGDFPGAADITGILRGGRRLELEVKRPGERPTEAQVSFGAMIQRYGGVWAVVHSVEEAIAVVEAALAEGRPA